MIERKQKVGGNGGEGGWIMEEFINIQILELETDKN